MKTPLQEKVIRVLARLTRKWHPRGTERFLRLLHHPDRRKSDSINLILDYNHNLKIRIDTSDFLEWLIFFFGCHEPELTNQINELFRPGFVAFDIGANSGSHTLVMSSRAGENGLILAVEPNPGARRRLKENIELNRLTNVRILSCALSNEPGHAVLFVPEERTSNRGVASLHSSNVNYPAEQIEIVLKTLDQTVAENCLNRLDFIKIDAEGNEMKILRGGRKTIRRFRPRIVFEYDQRSWSNAGAHFARAAAFFQESGYRLFRFDKKTPLPVEPDSLVHGNILAIPTPSPPNLDCLSHR